MSAMPARHVITADTYELMVEAGAFNDARVELMLGEIYDMSPIGSAHQACGDRLTRVFARVADSPELILRVQGSVRLGDFSEPQPDIALLRRRDDYYAGAHPGPGDILLVVEVADTSLRYDRSVKVPAYAAAGVPEAWLVDLGAATVEVSTSPSPRGYRQQVEAKAGAEVTPLAVPGLTVPVDDILGPPAG